MVVLAQNTFSIKRLLKEPLSLEFSSDTIAIPATAAGVADLTNAEFSVRVLKDSKELFPVYDESLGSEGRNLLKGTSNKFTDLQHSIYNGVISFNIPVMHILQAGDTVTYSFYESVPSESPSATFPRIIFYNGTTQIVSINGTDTLQVGSEGILYMTITVPEDTTNVRLLSGNRTNPASTPFITQIKNVKLELGSTPTPWLPAPEELLSTATITLRNCTAVVIDNRIKLTTLTPGTYTGWVDVEVSYGEGYTAKRRFTWAKVKEGKDGQDGADGKDGANYGNSNLINNGDFRYFSWWWDSLPAISTESNTTRFITVGYSFAQSYPTEDQLKKNNYRMYAGDYTVLAKVRNKNSSVRRLRIYHESIISGDDTAEIPATGQWVYVSMTFKAIRSDGTLHFLMADRDGNTTIDIAELMLVRGSTTPDFYKPSDEDISRRSEYITDAIKEGSSTDIDGGLVLANVLGMKDKSGEPRSYMSGLVGSNPTAFAAGVENFGTNEETKNVDIWHDGSAKIGVLEVDNSTGLVRVVENEITRFLITKQNLPTLLYLLSEATDTNGITPAPFSHSIISSAEQTRLIPNTLVLDKEDNTLTFTANCSVNCNASATPPGSGPHPVFGASISIYIYRLDGASYKLYSSVDFVSSSDGIVTKNINRSISNVPSGSYRVFLRYYLYPGGSLSLSAMTLSYVHNNEVRRIEYGKNGMMLFYNEAGKKNYLYMTNEGLSIGGETDMPGVLLAGTAGSTGGSSNWGAKKHADIVVTKESKGTYRIYHSIGHKNYYVSLAPKANRTFAIGAKENTYCTVYFYSGNTLTDTGFDFQLVGDNKKA